jgi:putative ABC transport system ATP-binding protein
VIDLQEISKWYLADRVSVPVLKDVSFHIEAGEFVALIGPSGSGKTTLMNIIGLLDAPSSGSIYIAGQEVSKFKPSQAAKLRNLAIGFVFQAFHLLPHLTALDNVAMPLIYRGIGRRIREELATEMLDHVGLGSFTARFPAQLSGGQRQRVAIARSLVGKPSILLADEPTGNLDTRAAAEIMDLFRTIQNEMDVTIVLVTHDLGLAAQCPRQLKLRDGILQKEQEELASYPEKMT